jgi:V-type H+-transporting ATPase subunit a
LEYLLTFLLLLLLINSQQGDNVYKSVFIIFFQGDQLKTRVKKICEGFRATLYPCPEAPADRREMAMGVMTRIEDLNTVLGQTQVRFLIFHNAYFK